MLSGINQFDEHFYDEVMGEYIIMTLSDDEGEDDYYNKEISKYFLTISLVQLLLPLYIPLQL
jgi:hypothetical protein